MSDREPSKEALDAAWPLVDVELGMLVPGRLLANRIAIALDAFAQQARDAVLGRCNGLVQVGHSVHVEFRSFDAAADFYARLDAIRAVNTNRPTEGK